MPITSGHHDESTHARSVRVLLERYFDLPDEAATDAFGARFARALDALHGAQSKSMESVQSLPRAGLQVHLLGEPGAGKTTLVRATLRALGYAARVRSPTYTLVEPYDVVTAHGSLRLYHFDLYRFNDPAEWADAGFRDYAGGGAICVVEWPQRAEQLLGAPDVEFTLDAGNVNGNGGGNGDDGGNGGSDGYGHRNEYRVPPGRILTARAYSHRGKACLEKC